MRVLIGKLTVSERDDVTTAIDREEEEFLASLAELSDAERAEILAAGERYVVELRRIARQNAVDLLKEFFGHVAGTVVKRPVKRRSASYGQPVDVRRDGT